MRAGRPRSTSPETIAEAACELFLERGYVQTTVDDIARRAGVARSSFFNYFASKSAVLWAGLDERIDAVEKSLDAGMAVREALTTALADLRPDSLALAMTHAEAMGLDEELPREMAWRRARLSAAVSTRVQRDGCSPLVADVVGSAHAGAVTGALAEWARRGPGHVRLDVVLSSALDAAAPTLPAPVRQLRVVARADDFEGALRFYRDVLGMPQRAAFQGDGGARVAILEAGRATVELANAAQIDMIDAVETDGNAPSESVRIGLEVDDAAAATLSATTAGALLEATPRETPWRSVNSRVRAPAGLQVTFFQELGEAQGDARRLDARPLP